MEKRKESEAMKTVAEMEFVSIVNRIRQEIMLRALDELNVCRSKAMEVMNRTRDAIHKLIASNRGGTKGVHGFIGEHAQVGISNARDLMEGNDPRYVLLDDNSSIDYFCDDVPIQQKAVISDGALGLTHVENHNAMYPDFQISGGKYQIPSDLYEEFMRYKNMDKQVAAKLRKPEWRLWKKIHRFLDNNPDIEIEPMCVSYDDIQANRIDDTLNREIDALETNYTGKKQCIIQSGKATLKEGAIVAAKSALAEGIIDGIISVAEHKQGKTWGELDKNDVKEIACDMLKGAGKGAIRGGAVYTITNMTKISAPVASAAVSTGFVIVDSVSSCVNGEITKKECAVEICEKGVEIGLCTTFAKIGESLIKRPYIGSIVGGAAGMLAAYGVKRLWNKVLDAEAA